MKNSELNFTLTIDMLKEALEDFYNKKREDEDTSPPTVVEVYPGIYSIGTKTRNMLTNYAGLQMFEKAMKEDE